MKKVFIFIALFCASLSVMAAPKSAAPVPTVPADQVMAVYSDSYERVCNWGYLEGWGQTTTLEEKEIDGNHYLSYANFNYLGWGAAQPYNVSMMEKLHLDIWVEADGQLGIVPIYGGSGLSTDDNRRKIVDLKGGQWNSLDLDLVKDFEGLNLSSIFQFKYDNGSMTEFCLDNVYFYRTTPLVDTEAPANLQASLASTSYFSVVLNVSATDNMGFVNILVLDGEHTVGSAAGKSGESILVTVENLLPATEYHFTVSVSDVLGNSCDPVQVSATTLTAPAPAPAPGHDAEDVKSLFSDEYTAVSNVANYCEWWYQSPVVYQKQLGEGENVLYYVSNLDGVFGWAFEQTDFTGYQKIHLSVYPTTSFAFEIYPVVPGEPRKASEPLAANKWNEVVLDYTELEAFGMKQLGFVNKAQTEFFLDNVYFFKGASGTGIDEVQRDEVQSTKVIEDGRVIIIKNGVRYNTIGQQIK